MTSERLRQAAEDAVRGIYSEEDVAIWWTDHNRQTQDEQTLRQRNVVALVDGAFL